MMNRNYTEIKFSYVARGPWNKTFPANAPQELIDLIAKMLAYAPSTRITPLVACTHSAFDELRSSNTKLPNGQPLPPLFNFTELELSINPGLNEMLLRKT